MEWVEFEIPADRDPWDDDINEAFGEWWDRYFEGNHTPDARGGFTDDDRGDRLTVCKTCGATVLWDGTMWGLECLNRHVAWHGKNRG